MRTAELTVRMYVLCALCAVCAGLWLAVQVAFGRDGNFSEVAFRDTVNACLANSIGNMLNRWVC